MLIEFDFLKSGDRVVISGAPDGVDALVLGEARSALLVAVRRERIVAALVAAGKPAGAVPCGVEDEHSRAEFDRVDARPATRQQRIGGNKQKKK